MQIVVPIAGRSTFFSPDHYFFPKPLIEVGGLTMIERVIRNSSTIDLSAKFIFVVNKEDVVRFSLDHTLMLLTNGNCAIVQLSAPTKGAACSVLMAIDQIDPHAPIIVSNGDQVIDANLAEYVKKFMVRQADAGVITFELVHPRWSYVETLPTGQVIQAAEKQVISRKAVAGFYFFRSGDMFTNAIMTSIDNKVSVGDQYFIAPALNEIIFGGGTVLALPVDHERYHSFYSPEKLRTYEDELIKRSIGHTQSGSASALRVLIPAAGEGNRFIKAGFSKPKPFIDVLGRPMIAYVIDNVSARNAEFHVLLRSDHATRAPDVVKMLADKRIGIHQIDQLTEGTACTLLLARKVFDDDNPLMVANSDQYVNFSVDAFVDDCFDRGLDGSILVFRDATRNPKWSFARISEDGLVEEVAEKRPISDLATVGVYLFKRGADFVRGAIDMIVRNDRINNEFYTCPVYNYLIRDGLRIGVYEVQPEAMHGLGTPEDLDIFVTLHRAGNAGNHTRA